MDTATAQKVCHIQDRVADRIGKGKYRIWFGERAEFQLNDDRLAVMVPNVFVGNWIANNYLVQLSEAAHDVMGLPVSVDIRVNQDSPKRADPARDNDHAAFAHPPARPRARGPRLRGELESFVVGPSNRLAYTAASALARNPLESFRSLVLHGACGVGKTHLLQGLCNSVRRDHPTLEWRYVSGEEFTNEFIYAVKTGRIDGFRQRFRNVDLLLIDDIHFLANKKATQDEFLHTFNAIDASGKVVVLSSDCHPRNIQTLSEPLVSRLIAGMVVEIDPPDIETRKEILRQRSTRMNRQIPENVIDFIAEHVTRNVRELEGAIYKLVALASLTQDPITLDLAIRALEDQGPRERRMPAPADIERIVAAYFGISVQQVHSRSRERTISLARAITVHLLRRHSPMSYPEIGRMMGHKNHSTMLMAAQRVTQQLAADAPAAWKTPDGPRSLSLKAVIAQLESTISNPPH